MKILRLAHLVTQLQMQMEASQGIDPIGEASENMQGQENYFRAESQDLMEDEAEEGLIENEGNEQNPFANYDIDDFFTEASYSFYSNEFLE